VSHFFHTNSGGRGYLAALCCQGFAFSSVNKRIYFGTNCAKLLSDAASQSDTN